MAMNKTEPKVALDELEDLRTRARRTAHASWVPLFVFGVLTLGAVPFALLGDDGYDGFYWLVAGPLGGAVTWQLVQRRGSEIGIFDRRARIYAAIIAAMVAGALIIGWSGESAFSEAGTLYPIAAGLLAIGAISRNLLIAAVGVAIASWGTAMLIAEPDEIAAWSYAGEGGVLLVAGIIALAQARPAAARAGLRSGATVGG
jgi:hypothetical protein